MKFEKANVFNKLNKIFHYSTMIISAYSIIAFLVISILRISYPYDLEWMEGTMVDHVWRIVNGLSIYTAPTLNFIPFIYTPLYFYISAWVSDLVGIGYFPLRLVSFSATIITFIFVFLIVKKETGSYKIAFLSMGFYAGCFEASGFWYDLARVDSLFIMFIILSFYYLRFYKNNYSLLISGIFASLAYLSKQTSIIIIVPMLLYILYERKWKTLYYIIPILLISFLTSIYLNYQSGGWFYFWLFELPSGHDWIFRKFITFWVSDIMEQVGFASIISLLFLSLKFNDNKLKEILIYIFFSVGMIACAWLSRIHYGGYSNVLMPAYLLIAILFGLGLNAMQNYFEKINLFENHFIKFLFLGLIIAQFSVFYFKPSFQMPNKFDREYGKKLIEEIKKYKGEVLIPDHPYYSSIAGKKSYAHSYVLYDFINCNSILSSQLNKEFLNSLRNHKYDAIILDRYPTDEEYMNYYKLKKILFEESGYLNCKTGGQLHKPQYLLIPK